MRYEVTLHGGSTGMFNFRWATRVEADDRKTAIEKARAEARDRGFGTYNRPKVVELRTYAVTLRGRDKRKRETFFAEAADPKAALFVVARNPNANLFAGYGFRKLEDPRIVRVEETSR